LIEPDGGPFRPGFALSGTVL